MTKLLCYLCLAFNLLLLSACGQTGKLYLPNPNATGPVVEADQEATPGRAINSL